MSFRAEIKGMDDFQKKLVGLRKDMTKILEEATQAGADVVADEANHLAPGPYIKTEVVDSTWTHADIDIGPDEDHWYYRFFEFGAGPHEVTPKNVGGLRFLGPEGEMIVRVFAYPQGMAADPFLRPAHDTKKDEAEEATGQVFLSVINKYLER
jgi:HK97 gp10 family phage protein